MNTEAATSLFAPAETKKAPEVIYDQIYQKIVTGELQPGDHLPPERELVDQFKRSRHIVREALRMLQQNGLIRIEVGSAGGAIVEGMSIKSVEEPLRRLIEVGVINVTALAEYRMINDLGCTRLAVENHNEEDAANLRRVIEEFSFAYHDSKLMQKVDVEFHKIVADATHNPLAKAISNVVTEIEDSVFWRLAEHIDEESFSSVRKKAYETHRNLAEAIIQRDLEVALQWTREIVNLSHSGLE